MKSSSLLVRTVGRSGCLTRQIAGQHHWAIATTLRSSTQRNNYSTSSICQRIYQDEDPSYTGRLGLGGPTEEEIKKYRGDSQTLARWLDVSVVKRKGRAFDADSQLIPAKNAMQFPQIQVSSLNGSTEVLPQVVDADVKLVVFSFKHYGFSLARSWMDPFMTRFPTPPYPPSSSSSSVVAVEICFVEFGFLSMAKNLFASSIKNNIAPSQVDYTFLAFGGVMVSLLYIVLTFYCGFFLLTAIFLFRILHRSSCFQMFTLAMPFC